MKPLRLAVVVALAIGSAAAGALVSAVMIRYGNHPFVVTPLAAILFVLVGVWLLVGGRAVRRLKARKDTWVSPVGAARIAVMARASAYVMGGSAGFLAGAMAVNFTRMWAPATAFGAWTALAGAVAAAFATVAAVVVERWCIDDADDEQNGPEGGRGKNAPHRPAAQ